MTIRFLPRARTLIWILTGRFFAIKRISRDDPCDGLKQGGSKKDVITRNVLRSKYE